MNHFLTLFGISVILFGGTALPQNNHTLKEVRTIELPKVNGRIDHLSIDVKSGRLFVAALGNGSIEIVDLKSGKVIHRITGLKEPQGVLYYSRNNLLFTTSAGDGTCKVYDASDFRVLKVIRPGDDADNIRYDKKRDIVFIGFGSGGIAAINPTDMNLIYKINLPAHPESFQVDESKGLMFVNIPDAREMEEINLNERKVTRKINLDVERNFPMALDTLNHLIFIGSRNPSKIVTFDEGSLKKISENNVSGDADDIFYDEDDSLLIVSCGSGYIDLFKQGKTKEFVIKERIQTTPGARTSLYVPGLHKLFVAARKYHGNNAKVIVYSLNP